MSTPAQAPRKAAATPPAFEEMRVSPLRNTVLLDYLAKRGIPSGIALGECVEVHYRTRGKWYFGIGFRNRKGGLEMCLLHNSKLLKQAIPFVAYIINY